MTDKPNEQSVKRWQCKEEDDDNRQAWSGDETTPNKKL
jgi:hypothetical protein